MPPTRRLAIEPLEDRATPAALDPTFGSGGTVSLPIPVTFDGTHGVAVQADGKIVVAGTTDANGGGPRASDMIVERLNANGALDTSFGSGGTQSVDFQSLGFAFASAYAVTVQADGKIVVAGAAATQSGYAGGDFAVARLTPDGSPDSTFGTAGRQVLTFGHGARAVAVQADGKIVLAGSAYSPNANGGTDFAVVRLNPNGSPDPTFGGGEKTYGFDLNPNPASPGYNPYGATQGAPNDDFASAVAVQPDGKIVVAGSAAYATTYYHQQFGAGYGSFTEPLDQNEFAVLRLNSDGTPDGTFGAGGKVAVQLLSADIDTADPDSVAVLADGRIESAGTAGLTVVPLVGLEGSPNQYAAVRLTAAGALDPTFDGDGRAAGPVSPNTSGTSNTNSGGAGPTVVEADGRVVVTGARVVLLQADGEPDPAYSDAGSAHSNSAAAVQSDGKVVLAGSQFVDRMSGDTPPTISPVPDLTARRDQSTGVVAFAVGDDLTPAGDLTVTATTSDATLLPVSGVALGGSGTDRTLTVTPAAGRLGAATVTLTVTDTDGQTAAETFTVTVTPAPVVLVGAAQFAVGGDAGSGTVTLYNADGTTRLTLTPFGATFTGGVRTAAADFNGDGVADVVAGTGPGGPSHVQILDGATGTVLFQTDPFEATFTGGVYVAAGDVTGDGVPDLVMTPDEGGGPRVRVFSGSEFGSIADFFGIDDPDFRGGARTAVGDVNGDGVGDLIVAAGFGGGPRVAGFDGKSLATGVPVKAFPDFLAFEPTLRNGVYVAVGDVDGDGKADVIAGGGPGGGPRVSVFAGAGLPGGTQTRVTDFFAGDPSDRGGARVAAKNLDGDDRADVVVGAGDGSRVTAYAGKSLGGSPPPSLLDFDPGTADGVFVG